MCQVVHEEEADEEVEQGYEQCWHVCIVEALIVWQTNGQEQGAEAYNVVDLTGQCQEVKLIGVVPWVLT